MRPPDETPSHHALQHVRLMHSAFILATFGFAITLLTVAEKEEGAPPDAPAAMPVAAAVAVLALGLFVYTTGRVTRAREGLPKAEAIRSVEHWMLVRLAGAAAIVAAGLWGSYVRGGALVPFVPAALVAVAAALVFFPRPSAFGLAETPTPS